MAGGRLEGLREPKRESAPTPTEEIEINPNESFTDDGYVPDEDFEENDFREDNETETNFDDLEDLFEDEADDFDALFEELDEDEERKPRDVDSVLDKFLEKIAGMGDAPKDENSDDDTFTSFFDNIYGDGLDFSTMFDADNMEEGQLDKINEELNKQFKTLTSTMTRKTMEAVMGLVDTHIKSTLENAQKEQTSAQVKTKLRSRIVKNMPFLAKEENAPIFKEMYERAYEKAEGDPKKTVDYIKKLYRKTNPEYFRNDKSSSFSRPRKAHKQQRGRTDKWSKFLNS